MASKPNSEERPDISRSGDAAKTHFGNQFKEDLDSEAIIAARRRGALYSVDESDYRAANNHLRVFTKLSIWYWVCRVLSKVLVFVLGAACSYGIGGFDSEAIKGESLRSLVIIVLCVLGGVAAIVIEEVLARQIAKSDSR